MANYILLTDEAAGLYHHGILGQKWGIRRYQNEDGTLTAEGKKRQEYKTQKEAAKQVTKDRLKKVLTVSTMSDEELTKATARLQAEANYATLVNQSVKNGRTEAEKQLIGFGKQSLDALKGVAAVAIAGGAAYVGSKLVNQKNPELSKRMFPNKKK
jgi:hypothetical protein